MSDPASGQWRGLGCAGSMGHAAEKLNLTTNGKIGPAVTYVVDVVSLLSDLHQRRLRARCPNCDEEFRLADARLFDATRRLPPHATQLLAAKRADLRRDKEQFHERRKVGPERSLVGARSATIGKVVEKIAPSLPGFPVSPADCRSLLEPIDYVVFRGLASKHEVEALYFVDVKSGRGRLTREQAAVRRLVNAGYVSLVIETGAFQEGKS